MYDIKTPLEYLWRRSFHISNVNTFLAVPGIFVKVNSDGTISAIVDGSLPAVVKQAFDGLSSNIYESNDVRGTGSFAVIEPSMCPPVYDTTDLLVLTDGSGNPITYTVGSLLTVAWKSGSGYQCAPADIGKLVLAKAGDQIRGQIQNIVTPLNGATVYTIEGVLFSTIAIAAWIPILITATAPASGADVDTAHVSYTLSKAAASGSVTFTRTGGTADVSSPHVCALTGAELNSGAHTGITLTNNPTLVDGTVYSVTFKAFNSNGIAAIPVTNTNVSYSTVAPIFSATYPGTGGSMTNYNVGYTLSEALASGSVTFTRTSGTADGGSPHISALSGSELNAGVKAASPLVNSPTLVDSTVYTVTFAGTDLYGNAATPVNNTSVTFNG